jgi:hypothetical protein
MEESVSAAYLNAIRLLRIFGESHLAVLLLTDFIVQNRCLGSLS